MNALSAVADGTADGVDHQLDPRYITLQRQVGWISAAAFILFCAAFVAFVVKFGDLPRAVSEGLVAAGAVMIIARAVWAHVGPPLVYRYASYRLDADGVEIRRGILWRRIINVPRSRVQHTDVAQGPFQRRHGLGTLIIHTAGAHHAVVSLHGLDHATALRIRDNLLPRGTVDVV